jgi:hypothetical protein
MARNPKFEIFKDKNKEFRFRLKAPNGEVILQSEGYKSKDAAKDTIELIGKYACAAEIVDLTKKKSLKEKAETFVKCPSCKTL